METSDTSHRLIINPNSSSNKVQLLMEELKQLYKDQAWFEDNPYNKRMYCTNGDTEQCYSNTFYISEEMYKYMKMQTENRLKDLEDRIILCLHL